MTPNRTFQDAKLVIMLYNILYGGHARSEREDRLPLITRVVAAECPHVLGVLEADYWDVNGRGKILGDQAGFGWFRIGTSYPSHHHLGIFAREELPEFRNNRPTPVKNAVPSAMIPWEPGGALNLFVVHLNSADEDARIPEVEALIDIMQSSERVLVIGDFNSLSPQDPYDREALLATLQEGEITKFGTNTLRFDVISAMLDAGFVDLHVSRHGAKGFVPTVPTPSNIDEFHAAHLRLDYAFASPGVARQLVDIRVGDGEDADRASDHYPLIITFRA